MRKRFFFVDHLVFSLNMHTFAFAALMVAAAAAQFVSGGWVAALTVLMLTLYLFFAMKRFYGQSWARTGLKFVGIGVIYTLLFLGPALAAAVIASVVSG